MTIQLLTIHSKFRYFWLKNVTGINLDQHCAKCLIGEYDPRLSPKINEYHNLELADGIYYLCGVSEPYVWSNNFHLAFTNGQDTIDYEFNGVHIIVTNAKRLPVDSRSEDILQLSKYKYKSYRTCRNWMFANWLKYSGIF